MSLAKGFLVFVMAVAATAGWAQSADVVQRERIARERRDAEADFLQQEYDCSRRFIVTSCMDKAKAARAAKVDSLRRQEEVLDSNERRRRAADRLEAIRLKTEAQDKLRPPRVPPAASAPTGATPASGSGLNDSVPPAGAGEMLTEEPGPAATTNARKPIKRPRDATKTAAEEAAAERAATAQRRRAESDRSLERHNNRPPSTKPPAAPLPPRPEIPPASSPGS